MIVACLMAAAASGRRCVRLGLLEGCFVAAVRVRLLGRREGATAASFLFPTGQACRAANRHGSRPSHSASQESEACATIDQQPPSLPTNSPRSPRPFSPATQRRVHDLTFHPAVVWETSDTFRGMRGKKLGRRHLPLFGEGQPPDEDRGARRRDRLFDRFARVVCCAAVIPRKEIFETWAAALYIHAQYLSGEAAAAAAATPVRRVADVAAGHGLLAWALLVLEDEGRRGLDAAARPLTAFCLDVRMPRSAEVVHSCMAQEWPHLEGRIDYVEGRLEQLVPHQSCLLASVHACGKNNPH